MTTNAHRESARIYAFPVRGRFAANSDREEPKLAANVMTPRATDVAFGSSWYHEEAIQDAERARKN